MPGIFFGNSEKSEEARASVAQRLRRLWPTLCNLEYSRFASEQQLELWSKNTTIFLSYLLQKEADSYKVWYMFSGLNLP